VGAVYSFAIGKPPLARAFSALSPSPQLAVLFVMKPLYSWLGIGLGFGLFFLFFNFLFDGLGFSRVSHYWEHYHGSMSWPAYRITLRPQGVAPAPAPSFPTLHYGFDLTDHVALKAQLLQSEIPAADMQPVLYDTTAFARFSPDSVYYAWVGLRGNAFSFALGGQPAFVVLSYRAAAAAGAHIPSYPVQQDWRGRWQLYAWAVLSLQLTFWLTLAGLYALSEERSILAGLLALVSLLLYIAGAAYVDWFDYSTGDEWPIMKPILAIGLICWFAAEVFGSDSKPEAEGEATAAAEA